MFCSATHNRLRNRCKRIDDNGARFYGNNDFNVDTKIGRFVSDYFIKHGDGSLTVRKQRTEFENAFPFMHQFHRADCELACANAREVFGYLWM